jgi:predicted DNA-binding transcriptional regulator YafY
LYSQGHLTSLINCYDLVPSSCRELPTYRDSMHRTERFYKIELLLRSRDNVNFPTLQQELGVSSATLKRDLNYLRNRLAAPIIYDRTDDAYRFQTNDKAPSDLWFGEQEIHALLRMHQLVSDLHGDGVLTRHMQPMLDKFESMLGTDSAQAKTLMRRVKIVDSYCKRAPCPHFELLGCALMQRSRLRLSSSKPGEKKISERDVSPQRLVHYRNTWYLDAWCHASETLCRIALGSIESAEVLETKARNVAVKELEAQLDVAYGLYSSTDAAVKWATLVFQSEAAHSVSLAPWHPQQKSRWLANGHYELQVPYIDPAEWVMDILGYADKVTVVGNKALVSAVKQRLSKALAQYG